MYMYFGWPTPRSINYALSPRKLTNFWRCTGLCDLRANDAKEFLMNSFTSPFHHIIFTTFLINYLHDGNILLFSLIYQKLPFLNVNFSLRAKLSHCYHTFQKVKIANLPNQCSLRKGNAVCQMHFEWASAMDTKTPTSSKCQAGIESKVWWLWVAQNALWGKRSCNTQHATCKFIDQCFIETFGVFWFSDDIRVQPLLFLCSGFVAINKNICAMHA